MDVGRAIMGSYVSVYAKMEGQSDADGSPAITGEQGEDATEPETPRAELRSGALSARRQSAAADAVKQSRSWRRTSTRWAKEGESSLLKRYIGASNMTGTEGQAGKRIWWWRRPGWRVRNLMKESCHTSDVFPVKMKAFKRGNVHWKIGSKGSGKSRRRPRLGFKVTRMRIAWMFPKRLRTAARLSLNVVDLGIDRCRLAELTIGIRDSKIVDEVRKLAAPVKDVLVSKVVLFFSGVKLNGEESDNSEYDPAKDPDADTMDFNLDPVQSTPVGRYRTRIDPLLSKRKARLLNLTVTLKNLRLPRNWSLQSISVPHLSSPQAQDNNHCLYQIQIPNPHLTQSPKENYAATKGGIQASWIVLTAVLSSGLPSDFPSSNFHLT
ncbi:hypothetical protein B0H13DRAFT_1920271 [Mycena leptocephala]|nr:hypothetical protein B0H13DRAFT_1920271 [Mycena leptocephala]